MTNRIHDFAEGLSMPKIHIYQRQCQKEKSKPNNLRPAYFSFESTHAQKPFISPCVNWEDVLDKTINLQQSMQDDRI